MNRFAKILMAVGGTALMYSPAVPSARVQTYMSLGGGILSTMGGLLHDKPQDVMRRYEKEKKKRQAKGQQNE